VPVFITQKAKNPVTEEGISSSAYPKLKTTLPPATTNAVEELFLQSRG
jgi:hypothetical protein